MKYISIKVVKTLENTKRNKVYSYNYIHTHLVYKLHVGQKSLHTTFILAGKYLVVSKK